MSAALESFLEEKNGIKLSSTRKVLSILKEAYSEGLPGLMARPQMDHLTQTGAFTFQIGTPDPEMRIIASWLISKQGNNHRSMKRLLRKLWIRGGREDKVLAGLLLANSGRSELNEDPWIVLVQLFSKKESIELLLDIGEEMMRGGHELPNEKWFVEMAGVSSIWHQYSIIFISLMEEYPPHCVGLARLAKPGGEIFERLRKKILESTD